MKTMMKKNKATATSTPTTPAPAAAGRQPQSQSQSQSSSLSRALARLLALGVALLALSGLATSCGDYSDKPSPYVPATVGGPRNPDTEPLTNPDGPATPTLYGGDLQE